MLTTLAGSASVADAAWICAYWAFGGACGMGALAVAVGWPASVDGAVHAFLARMDRRGRLRLVHIERRSVTACVACLQSVGEGPVRETLTVWYTGALPAKPSPAVLARASSSFRPTATHRLLRVGLFGSRHFRLKEMRGVQLVSLHAGKLAIVRNSDGAVPVFTVHDDAVHAIAQLDAELGTSMPTFVAEARSALALS